MMRVHLCMNTELVVSDQAQEIEKMMQMARQLKSPHKPFSLTFYQQIQRVAIGYKKKEREQKCCVKKDEYIVE